MGRKCQLSGKKRSVKNNVSHSKRRTKSVQNPNLQLRWFVDEKTGQRKRLLISTKMIKTISKLGGLKKTLQKMKKKRV